MSQSPHRTQAPAPLSFLEGRRGLWLLVALALVLFTWRLGSNDLWAPDEPYFAEGAREMLVDGNWLVPHINGELDNHKPPLFFWSIALMGAISGGVDELAARLPSVLAALGTLWLTMRFGARFSPLTGRLAVLLLCTMFMFWDKARWAQTDSMLCFWITLALVLADRLDRPDPRSLGRLGAEAGLLWIALSAAILTKGPIGLVLPIVILVARVTIERRPLDLMRLQPLLGAVVLTMTVGAWAWIATRQVDGYSALQSAQEHFVDRAAEGMHHVQPFWYYGEVWSYALLPWSFLFPGLLLYGWKRREDRNIRFLLIWIVATFGLFSLSVEKRDLYILPALPAIAVLMSEMLRHVVLRRPDFPISRRWVLAGFQIMAVLFAVTGLLAPFAVSEVSPEHGNVAFIVAAFLLLTAIAILLAAWRSVQHAVLTTAATGAVTLLALVTFVYPAMEPDKSGRPLADAVARLAPDPGQRLVGLDLANIPRSINFYTNGRYLDLVDSPRQALEMLSTGRYALLVANAQLLREGLVGSEFEQLDIAYETRINRRRVVIVRAPDADRLRSSSDGREVPSVKRTDVTDDAR